MGGPVGHDDAHEGLVLVLTHLVAQQVEGLEEHLCVKVAVKESFFLSNQYTLYLYE